MNAIRQQMQDLLMVACFLTFRLIYFTTQKLLRQDYLLLELILMTANLTILLKMLLPGICSDISEECSTLSGIIMIKIFYSKIKCMKKVLGRYHSQIITGSISFFLTRIKLTCL